MTIAQDIIKLPLILSFFQVRLKERPKRKISSPRKLKLSIPIGNCVHLQVFCPPAKILKEL